MATIAWMPSKMHIDGSTPLIQTLPVAIDCLAAVESYVAGVNQDELHASQVLRDAVARNLALVAEVLEDAFLWHPFWKPHQNLPQRLFFVADELQW